MHHNVLQIDFKLLQRIQVCACHVFEFENPTTPIMSWSTMMTQYQIAVEVDSWSIVQLIMPLVIDDPIEWAAFALKRSEVPSEALGVVTPKRHAFNRRLCLFLRSKDFTSTSQFVSHFLSSSVKDKTSVDDSLVQSEFFRIPGHFLNAGGTPEQFLNAVFVWYNFLCQNHFRPYWDSDEGVGIQVMRDFHPPHDLRQLEGFSVRLPATVQDSNPPKFIRDSRTKDLYIGGPVSLVNHACSKHSNCVLNLTDRVRLAADKDFLQVQKENQLWKSLSPTFPRLLRLPVRLCQGRLVILSFPFHIEGIIFSNRCSSRCYSFVDRHSRSLSKYDDEVRSFSFQSFIASYGGWMDDRCHPIDV